MDALVSGIASAIRGYTLGNWCLEYFWGKGKRGLYSAVYCFLIVRVPIVFHGRFLVRNLKSVLVLSDICAYMSKSSRISKLDLDILALHVIDISYFFRYSNPYRSVEAIVESFSISG